MFGIKAIGAKFTNTATQTISATKAARLAKIDGMIADCKMLIGQGKRGAVQELENLEQMRYLALHAKY